MHACTEKLSFSKKHRDLKINLLKLENIFLLLQGTLVKKKMWEKKKFIVGHPKWANLFLTWSVVNGK